MKITFVAKGSEQLPISLLAAIAKGEGHQVGVAYSVSLFQAEIASLGRVFDDRSDVIQAIKDQKPDVLAFSVLTMNYQWMLGIAREAKELFPDVKTIFGGVHTSAVPDRVLANPEVDYVVIGEGDFAFTRILRAIAKGGPDAPIANARFKSNDRKIIRGMQAGFIQDLDSLPAFDKTIWEDHLNVGSIYLTMASRGCPYRCSFCFNNFFARLPDEKKGKYVRTRSVEHMINELAFAKKRYHLKFVDFQDDVFTVYKPWVKEFLEAYKKEIDVPFSFLSHPHYMDDEVMRWLKEAGAAWAQMGIQSMDEEFKIKSLHRYEDSKEIEQALESAHKYGIKIKVDHMFGLPGEPAGAQEKAMALYSKHSPRRISTYWTCFLPGTDLMKQGLNDGILTQEQADKINDGLVSYTFGKSDGLSNSKLERYFNAYELLFKVFPVIPRVIRERINPKYLERIPTAIFRPIAMAIDLCNSFITRNPDYTTLFNSYGFHLRRLAARKFGIRLKPNKVNEAIKPEFKRVNHAEATTEELLESPSTKAA
jgi:radical SAM superfamily enzyme YgiQ (UPF0313 family)